MPVTIINLIKNPGKCDKSLFLHPAMNTTY
uniref:Uncharacterized protein n=1 Tax=Anguilla anguilla TaxID=7936 RepID=A0A0E9SIP4_ANGAN